MANHVLKNVEGFVGRGSEIYKVDPRVINVVGGWNHRTDFSGEDELMASIIENGVRVPILVKKNAEGTLDLVDGERRLRATLRAISEGNDIQAVPVEVAKRGTSDIALYLESFLRNDSKPPTPTEEATFYKRLSGWGFEPKQIASKVGRSYTHVLNRLSLSGASPAVKDAINNGDVTVKDAMEIVKDADGSVDAQAQALEKKKATPKPKRVVPLTLFIGGDAVKSKGAKNGNECQPLIDAFTDKGLRDKIREAGFDPDTIQVKIKAVEA